MQPGLMPRLDGRHVVITRPIAQARLLAQAVRDLGAIPVIFPAIEILDAEDRNALPEVAARLDQFSLAIFISANAVDRALDEILKLRAWPARTRAATMGNSSEAALARHGVGEVIAPRTRFDSEALLALPELSHVEGCRIVIFRGGRGRELLGDTLTIRGAAVEYVECYRRVKPQQDPAPLIELWSAGMLDAVTLSSSEGMRNFHEMIGLAGQFRLRTTPVFVAHARIAEGARQLGLNRVVLTGPGDAGLLAGLIEYFGADESDSAS